MEDAGVEVGARSNDRLCARDGVSHSCARRVRKVCGLCDFATGFNGRVHDVFLHSPVDIWDRGLW